MNHWLMKAKENLSRLSNHKNGFETAKAEWIVSEYVRDCAEDELNEDEWPSCELCEHDRLRWQFEIVNKLNNNKMLVGSTCITQFDIALINLDNSEVYGEERDKILQKRVTDKKQSKRYEKLLELLRSLWKSDRANRNQIAAIAKEWKVSGKFGPSEAVFILESFKKNNIECSPRLLAVRLRKTEDKYKAGRISAEQFEILSAALTEHQLLAAQKFRKEFQEMEIRKLRQIGRRPYI